MRTHRPPSPFLVTALLFLACNAFPGGARAEGGSVHNHLTLDLMPLAASENNPIGGAVALSYDRYHDWLRSSYVLSFEASTPFSAPQSRRIDLIAELGFFTEITKAFSVGARVGIVANNPESPAGLGALALRLPALAPEDKQFLSFFFEEIDLGVTGAGGRYAAFRLGMMLL